MNIKKYKVLILISSVILTIIGMGCNEIVTPPDNSSPETPRNFVLIGGGDGQAFFRWEGNTQLDFEEYRLYRSVNNPDLFSVLVTLNQSEYVDRFLDYDSTYYYYLTAVDYAGNESLPTNIISVQPLNTSAPQPPSRLNAAGYNNPQAGSLEIQLGWVPPDIGDLKNYLVYRSTDSLFTPDAATFLNSTNIALYVDRFVQINQNYYYKVIAVDKGDKQSLPSRVSGDLLLSSPVLISPANNTIFGNPQTFKWNKVSGAFEYKVFVSNGPFSEVIWSSNTTKNTEVSYSGSTLQTSKIYYWWVGVYSKEKIEFEDNTEYPAQINSYSLIYSFFVE